MGSFGENQKHHPEAISLLLDTSSDFDTGSDLVADPALW